MVGSGDGWGVDGGRMRPARGHCNLGIGAAGSGARRGDGRAMRRRRGRICSRVRLAATALPRITHLRATLRDEGTVRAHVGGTHGEVCVLQEDFRRRARRG
jgi:hypothetical protein